MARRPEGHNIYKVLNCMHSNGYKTFSLHHMVRAVSRLFLWFWLQAMSKAIQYCMLSTVYLASCSLGLEAEPP